METVQSEFFKLREREQKKIVTYNGSNLLVYAGPGAGKTYCLKHRMKYLVDQGAPLNNIYAISFTNATVEKLKTEIAELLREDKSVLINISTIHSLCRTILNRRFKEAKVPPGFHVIGTDEEKRLIAEDIKEDFKVEGISINLNSIYSKNDPDCLLRAYEKEKAIMAQDIDYINRHKLYPRFKTIYDELLNYYDSIDWYDVVYRVVTLFGEDEDIVNKESADISHLLVDEFQDLNKADQAFVEILSRRSKCTIVFGDRNQSIYGGRYANPAGMRDYIDRTKADVEYLRTCTRSPKEILGKAALVIKKDTGYEDKTLIPNPSKIGVFRKNEYKSQEEELGKIIEEIQIKNGEGMSFNDIFILFLFKGIGKKYVEEIRSKDIPIISIFELEDILEKEGISLQMILRFLRNHHDTVSLRFILSTILNISISTISKLRNISKQDSITFYDVIKKIIDGNIIVKRLSKNVKTKLSDLYSLINELEKMEDSADQLIEGISKKFDKDYEKLKQILFTAASKIKEKASEDLTIEDLLDSFQYLREPELLLDIGALYIAGSQLEGKNGYVKAMTIHKSKGLDSEVVFVPTLEQEYIPGRVWKNDQDGAVRLLYVAMTRSKSFLMLSSALKRIGSPIYYSKVQKGFNFRPQTSLIKDL